MFKKLFFLRFVILLGEVAINFGDRGLFYIRLIFQRQLKKRGAKFLPYFIVVDYRVNNDHVDRKDQKFLYLFHN